MSQILTSKLGRKQEMKYKISYARQARQRSRCFVQQTSLTCCALMLHGSSD